MAVATRITWEKHLLNLAMAFSPLNPSEPTSQRFMRNTNKRLRRLLLQDRGTAKEKQMSKRESTKSDHSKFRIYRRR